MMGHWLRIMATTLAFVLVSGLAAHAHFRLNLNVRIVHVEHRPQGLQLYLRLPLPYLLADKVGDQVGEGLPEPAPFTSNAMEDGKLVHYLDIPALARQPLALGRFAAAGHAIVVEGVPLSPTVERVHVYRIGFEPDFATLGEAKAAFASNPTLPDAGTPLYVGNSVVDVVLLYPHGEPADAYTFSSSLDPGLPGQEETANLILNYGAGGTEVYRARGLLRDPMQISRSAFAAVSTFIIEGIRHILEGLDHVLFVLCLTLGATTLSSLVWRVTGFTLGHSVTLSLGFFGFVPSGAWFVPAVETGIALSILYAAAVAVLAGAERGRSERSMIVITTLIGLLHGLGFSFVLHEILKIDAPNLWQSLLSFNLGVEFGQLAIILLAWPLFRFIQFANEGAWRFSRYGIAAACAAIALFWSGERTLGLLASF